MIGARRPGWYQRTSLRLRMVLITVTAVAAVVAVGGMLIIVAVRAELIDATDEASHMQAKEVADLSARGILPGQLPVEDLEVAVQVVADGRVVSASGNVTTERPFALPEQPPGTRHLVQVDRLPFEESGPFRVAAVGTTTPNGPATVFVGKSTEDIDDITARAVRIGSLGLVLLILPLSGVLWLAIGRTLAPVETIRERADAITGRYLHRRVPEPVQQDEIGRLARTINAMLARLQDSADRQHRFLADSAHELRNPVASLRTQLETAQHPGRGVSIEELAPDLMADTLRMQTVVDQLLLLARSDPGLVKRNRVAVDLDDTIETVVSSLARDTAERDVDIDQTDVRPVQLMGDPALLEQAVRNLLDNAVRHADHQVHISLAEVDEHAVLTVDDDGLGIPPQHREHVLDPFARLADSRNRGHGGVGLGLAIVSDIAHAHGGSVVVGDSPAAGARFRVTLPVSGATT